MERKQLRNIRNWTKLFHAAQDRDDDARIVMPIIISNPIENKEIFYTHVRAKLSKKYAL